MLTSCAKASNYVILDDMTAIADPSRRMLSFASTGRSLVSRHVAWYLHLSFSTRHWMTLDVELSGVPPGKDTIFFTICLCISPDLKGYRAPKMKHGMFLTTRRRASGSRCFTICFTICLFISPDLDGHRAPKGINPTRPTRSRNPNTKSPRYVHDMFHGMFFFISPDLDGYRALKGINPTRPTRSRSSSE